MTEPAVPAPPPATRSNAAGGAATGAPSGPYAELAVPALRELVTFRTVAGPGHDPAPFERQADALRRHFPLLFATLEIEPAGEHGLLCRWPGRRSDRPIVLMAHQDVVPVADGDPWTHPAFDGQLADGVIWGRGTLDDKGSLVAICTAVEVLLAGGHTPAQDVWLSFGADEEVFGDDAQVAASLLAERGVRPWFVVDEGGAVAADALPGLDRPVAVIGVTEKGTTTLELTVTDRGGHASTPARMGATARLARAVLRVDRCRFPAGAAEPTIALLHRVSPYLPAAAGRVLAQADRLSPLVIRALIAGGPETAAMVRTTAVATMLQGSSAPNALASSARAVLNVRIAPGDSVASVVQRLRRAIADPAVEVRVVAAGEPSPISPYDGDPAFAHLEDTVREVFPDAVPAPYVVMAATDARHFTQLCERVYRFAPIRMSRAQRASIHSYDEHVSVNALAQAARWYARLIERLEP